MELSTLIALILIFFCILGLSWFAGSDAPFIPTQRKKIKKILKLAGVKKGKVFYELGSGDGRVVIEAAKLGASSFGVDQSWLRVWYSRYLAFREKLKKCFFFHGNLFSRNYFPADIIYIYLLQKAIDKLEAKLKKELKKGAIVITQKYHFKTWKSYKRFGDFNLYKV